MDNKKFDKDECLHFWLLEDQEKKLLFCKECKKVATYQEAINCLPLSLFYDDLKDEDCIHLWWSHRNTAGEYIKCTRCGAIRHDLTRITSFPRHRDKQDNSRQPNDNHKSQSNYNCNL